MDSLIILRNELLSNIDIDVSIFPDLSRSYWDTLTSVVVAGQTEPVAWVSRATGLRDHGVWALKISLQIAGADLELLVELTGTRTGSDVKIGISSDQKHWDSEANDQVSATVSGKDGVTIQITGREITDAAPYPNIEFTVREETETVGETETLAGATPKKLDERILPQIKHVVVLMFENRSFDNIFGYLYQDGEVPKHYVPPENQKPVDGLSGKQLENASYYVNGGVPVYASCGTTSWAMKGTTIGPTYIPTPDPGEEFGRVKNQIVANMHGFLNDYVYNVKESGGSDDSARQIMQSYSPEQLPVISSLARSFAVSDAWYASVPSQTWPNRAFLQAGSSGGHVNNTILPWDFPTIFDVLSEEKISWQVYNNSWLLSLTKAMFLPRYVDNEENFSGFIEFETACANGSLPTFSFLEPSFGPHEHDESYHPPYDVTHGEVFLSRVYDCIRKSPRRDEILFVVLFDEHGGTYDHVEPPTGAKPPNPGPVATDQTKFNFERYGVRIPAIVISSYVAPGTVFRSKTGEPPFDHTSVLATLRDWLGLGNAFASKLPSPRIQAAPTLADVLDQQTPREWPDTPQPSAADLTALATRSLPDDRTPLNHNQPAILVAATSKIAGRPLGLSERIEAFDRLKTHGDARAWLGAIKPHPPIR